MGFRTRRRARARDERKAPNESKADFERRTSPQAKAAQTAVRRFMDRQSRKGVA